MYIEMLSKNALVYLGYAVGILKDADLEFDLESKVKVGGQMSV